MNNLMEFHMEAANPLSQGEMGCRADNGDLCDLKWLIL
jgi:hypothetical protein